MNSSTDFSQNLTINQNNACLSNLHAGVPKPGREKEEWGDISPDNLTASPQ